MKFYWVIGLCAPIVARFFIGGGIWKAFPQRVFANFFWLIISQYFESRQEQLALREELKEKPIELKRYEKKLRDATF